MKKVFKKITALAAALMMVPVMTVSAAPPVNALNGGDVYEEITNMFPDLTEDESKMITELTYIHSDLESSSRRAVSFEEMMDAYGFDLRDDYYGHIIAAYGVVFAGASRDWCISMGVDPAKMDAVIAKLNGGAGASAAGQSQSASAPVWKQDGNGWWIENPDGSYLINQWYQSPASGLWYYMGSDGYMLTNTTTPDGFAVNADGVWVQ